MTANDSAVVLEIDLKHFYSVLSQSQSEQTLIFFFYQDQLRLESIDT